MSFELDPTRVPARYSTFRTDIATIQHTYVKQAIRQWLQEVVGNEEIASIIGPKKAEVAGRVTTLLEDRLSGYGVLVKQFIEAINQKNVMQQQALTADSIKAVGRAKAILAEAEAQSKANRLLSESITPTLVQYEMSKRWNGQMPQVSGAAVPMIQLPGATK